MQLATARPMDHSRSIDMTDIPAVTADEMWRMIELLIDSNLIEELPRALTPTQSDALIAAFWKAHQGTGNQGLAIVHRFMALLDFLSARRLAPMIKTHKWQIVVAAADIAATMRLNPKWGFNKLKLANALDAHIRRPGAVGFPTSARLQDLLANDALDAGQDWRQAA